MTMLDKESAAPGGYFFTAVCWLATHCHFPSFIFTQVSVQRSRRSTLVPSPSTPLPTQAPVAIAVSPYTDTFTSLISFCSHLPPFRFESNSDLPERLPSTSVLMKLSASRGATFAASPAFCASAHACSR